MTVKTHVKTDLESFHLNTTDEGICYVLAQARSLQVLVAQDLLKLGRRYASTVLLEVPATRSWAISTDLDPDSLLERLNRLDPGWVMLDGYLFSPTPSSLPYQSILSVISVYDPTPCISTT